MFIIFRILVLVFLFYLIYRFFVGPSQGFSFGNLFSNTKRCPRCKGKGWWQNTRNRETCEWCKGEGRLPRDFPTHI